jgi:site-specific DNA recombinase
MTNRAVLYARVSGDDRQNATSSLQGQLDLCRDYALNQGWQIIAELAEDERGASGALYDLPQLNKALELAKAGEFDVLVTRELDRLARKLAKQLVIETEFSRSGVIIAYAIGNYEDTPEGQLNKQIRAVIAEYERVKINERMVSGRRRTVKAGNVLVHGNPPYGYTIQKDDHGARLIIEETTAEIVRMIFEWYVINQWGAPKICRELNRLEVPPPSVAKKVKTRKAPAWNQSQVSRIVSNETYAGTWRYGKRNRNGKNPKDFHIAVNVPAIVSREIFDQAQEQRQANVKLSKRNRKGCYQLARRCFCGECQASMVSLTSYPSGKRFSYYRCPVPHAHDTHFLYKQCTMTTHFRVDYWDHAVWQEIRGFLSNPSKVIKGIKQYQQQQEKRNEPSKRRLGIIDDLLEKKRSELGRLLDLYLAGEFEKEVLLERKQRLQETITAIEQEKESINAQLKQTLTIEQIAELQAVSERIAEGLCEADENIETRMRLYDYLELKVTLSVEDKKQIADVYCEFGYHKRLFYGEHLTIGSSSHRRESPPATSSHAGEGDNYSRNCMHNTGCNKN